jgi:SAM-dependent methyltransferase
MIALTDRKKKVMEYMDVLATRRDRYIKKNIYYYNDLVNFFKFHIPEGSSVLEIGCGTGDILNSVKPGKGVGIDISSEMVSIASRKYRHLTFLHMDAENLMALNEKFDFIIISDTLGYFEDVQKSFEELRKVSSSDTRIIITYHNYLWSPVLSLAEVLKLKMPYIRLNWLNYADIANLLHLEGFDIIKTGSRVILPKYIPVLSWFANKYVAHLPFFNRLCLTGYIVARGQFSNRPDDGYRVSVIIPARNEKGNIEDAVKRMPQMGKGTEIIFIEGHSSDGTLDEIKRVCEQYSDKFEMRYGVQDGKGKGDAVRKGFGMAKGEVLMILDADLTVPPEDLPKFYKAIASGAGEFINGCRLVYPMEKEAMRLLNIAGNKFFSMMFSWLLEQRIKDTLCGTKVLFRKDWEKIVANRGYFGEFDPFGDFDMIFGAAKLNLKIVEVAIRYRARTYGETNISRFKHGWLLLKMVAFAMNKIKFI